MNERNRLAQLQKEYRRAWNNLITEVESLQAVLGGENAEQDEVEQQRARVEVVSAAYRGARNALAEHLLECGIHPEQRLAVAG